MTDAHRPEWVYAARWRELAEALGWDLTDEKVLAFVRESEYRDQDLENHLAVLADPRIPSFTKSSIVYTSTSPPWTPWRQIGVGNVRVLLGTAGSSTTTVEVQKDGTAFETIDLASSETDSGIVDTTAELDPGDLLTVEITAAGTGARDLTVVLW